MKTILDLPENLVEDEIFSRLSISSLNSVRTTCKKWNILLKNQILLGEAAERRKKHFLMLDSKSKRICLMNFDILRKDKDDGEPSIKQVSVLAQIQISNVFQCDGLLLCVLEDDSSRLLVWNPYLGQTTWIEPRHSSFHSSDRFALGYDNNNNNHKILRISTNEEHVLGFELYEFSSSSWKVLDDVTSEHVLWSHAHGGVSLKGNTYFRASPVASFLCFDFTAESFGPLLPLPPSHSYDGLHFLSFSCVREEQQLAVLYQHWQTRQTIEISVTDKIGPDVVSWTKFLRVVTDYWVDPSAGSFLVDEEKKIAVVFVLERVGASGCLYQTAHVFGQDGYFTSVRIREAHELENKVSSPNTITRRFAPVVCSSYLPSLLQLNQPG
ncbi:F-box/kelch-repeat protein At3g13680-like [Raphanus sativus]|uniref:F-box/kelch-repeat protein At3g13680-like n=1 Tax=Raphanus sativus TaxID=3726 RepID=A0A9W3D5C2_RAPSA|nr:F-box/kelch-repeat protein At3g13680-like [Raphanus sativus]